MAEIGPIEVPVRLVFRPGPPATYSRRTQLQVVEGDAVEVLACNSCGALVPEDGLPVHSLWHAKLEGR